MPFKVVSVHHAAFKKTLILDQYKAGYVPNRGLMTRVTWPEARRGFIRTLFSKGGVDRRNKYKITGHFVFRTDSMLCMIMLVLDHEVKISSFKVCVVISRSWTVA